MAIHMIAIYVPNGSTVRFNTQHTIYEGMLERSTLHVLTADGAVAIERDTLLEVVHFPHENLNRLHAAAPIPMTTYRSPTGGES